jgi:hypothetical protein
MLSAIAKYSRPNHTLVQDERVVTGYDIKNMHNKKELYIQNVNNQVHQ